VFNDTANDNDNLVRHVQLQHNVCLLNGKEFSAKFSLNNGIGAYMNVPYNLHARGSVVVKAVRYKPEGRGCETR
jgi:hypothetical protein